MEEITTESLGAVPNLSTLASPSSYHQEWFGTLGINVYNQWTATEAWDGSHEKETLHSLGVPTYDNIDWGTSHLQLQVYFPTDIGTDYWGTLPGGINNSGTQHYVLDHLRVGFCSAGLDGSAYYYKVESEDAYLRYIKFFDYNTSHEASLHFKGQNYNYLACEQNSIYGMFEINPYGVLKNVTLPFEKKELGIGILPVYTFVGIESTRIVTTASTTSQTFTKYDI